MAYEKDTLSVDSTTVQAGIVFLGACVSGTENPRAAPNYHFWPDSFHIWFDHF